jgi:hypothetical protein
MPYIKQEERKKLDSAINVLIDMLELNEAVPGDFNYTITRLIHSYIKNNNLKYQNINDMIGMLECAKLELYRKVAGPYEDTKIAENGDVSEI